MEPITVLLVEDEELLRVTVSKILRKKGFSVIEASDGPAAVELFAANLALCSVAFLDMTLPGCSGPEVAKTLRRIRPGIQIVLTTAYSQDAALLEFDGDKPRYFIRKPYKIDELVQLLRVAAHHQTAYAVP